MALSHLNSIRYWHRPGGGLHEILKYAKQHSVKSIHEADNNHVELWVGSIVALTLQQIEGKKFWIAKPENDPPDIAIMTINESGVFQAREVEVTRAFSPDKTLLESILHKDKPYPEEYILACFIEFPGEQDLLELSKELSKRLKHIKNVVLVFHGMELPYPGYVPSQNEIHDVVSVMQVSPAFSVTQISLIDALKEWQSDDEKLVYVRDRRIYWGLRPEDKDYPHIV